MIFSFCFSCVFALLVNKVCLQVRVEGFIGGSVVLPCSSTEHDLKPQDIYVYWVYSVRTYVFDIIKGEESEAGQDPRYKNRTKTFPDEYLRGNFSLKLINLTETDAGEYTCFIQHSSESNTVELILKESTVEKGNQTQTGTDPDVKTSSSYHWVYIAIPVLLLIIVLFIIAGFIIFNYRKRAQACSLSSATTEEQTTVT
ncbi:CD276 antigen homolog isoform X6 [Carassius gibelio]|uniref:CD276 antigen homolog isoform X5 n=1 Tax=Carassius gibelio TaxID=101364 RepID=UPI002278A0C5|nr:CD276 antigen homolog isoform X5 [Carassius gibelio]XP_052395373.1 CD276 antigen homolog isoform X6 [Carassius gibelio]